MYFLKFSGLYVGKNGKTKEYELSHDSKAKELVNILIKLKTNQLTYKDISNNVFKNKFEALNFVRSWNKSVNLFEYVYKDISFKYEECGMADWNYYVVLPGKFDSEEILTLSFKILSNFELNPHNTDTNFEKVLEFNNTFDVETNFNVNKFVFDTSPDLINYRLSLILEEVKELEEAIKQKDFKETVDALTDILYVTYGAFTALGVDADSSFFKVHESNMSKICNSEEEAKETVEWYKSNEKQRYDSPCYKKVNNGVGFVVYNKSTNKVLKNINYIPVEFEF